MRFKILKFSALFLVLVVLSFAVFALVQATSHPPTFCGDGTVQDPNDDGVSEACDDGNTNDCDGCKGDCSRADNICGDGEMECGERCDDSGNETWCTATCGQKILNWAWADTFGWLSLSCKSDPGVTCDPATGGVPYYVQVAPDNRVLGWAWSDNIGYVCFGESCDPANICEFGGGGCVPADYGSAEPTGGWQANVLPDGSDSPPITGWAKAGASLGDDGWFSLSCDNDGTCSTADYRLALVQIPGTCSLTYKECDPNNPGCDPALNKNCCDSVVDGTCLAKQRFTLRGWAWNNNSSGSGMGWLNFDPPTSTPSGWLQTKFGDIYARKGISGPESPAFNATYRILASGAIDRFISARGAGVKWIDPSFGPINFPTPETRYSNILGQLDVEGLKTCSGSPCQNKFGQTVVAITDQTGIANPLAGQIYYANSNLNISSAIEFENSSDFVNGAGTIIVDGDLIINADLTYQSTSNLDKFRNLATVAWIVLGDLKISPDVKELVGNFIVLGDGSACDPDPAVVVPGCGQIYSCDGAGDCSLERLTVSGLMMARKFYLGRTFVDIGETPALGSEVIIYDGRLLANTPPGLGDFAKALPIWRSGTFSQ